MAQIAVVALVPLALPGGIRVERGETTLLSEDDAKARVEAGQAVMAGDVSASDEVVDPSILPEWTKKMSPKEYLEKYPSGPAAELALRHVKATEEAPLVLMTTADLPK